MMSKAVAVAFALTLFSAPVRAEEQQDTKPSTPPAAAESAKPAEQPKADGKAGGCAPDGSCCNNGTCNQMGGDTPAATGCSCGKRKQM